MTHTRTREARPYLVEGPEVAIQDGEVLDSQHVIVLLIVIEALHPWVGISVRERHREHGGFIKQPSGTTRQMKSTRATVHLSSV